MVLRDDIHRTVQKICCRIRKGDKSSCFLIVMRQFAIIEVWTSLLLDFDPASAGPRLTRGSLLAGELRVFPNFDSFESIDASSSFSHFPSACCLTLPCVSEDAATSQANPIPKPQAETMATASTPKIITLEEGWNEEIKKKVSNN